MRLAKFLTPVLATAVVLSFAACSKSDSGNTQTAAGGGDTAAGAMAANNAGGNSSGSTSGPQWNGSYTQAFPQVQTIAMRTFNGNAQDAAAGRAVFLKYNCVGCHGGLAGGAMGPSLRDDQWKYGGSDEQILNTLHNGRPGGMPAWKGKIPENQLKQVVAYIHSMRTPQEPTSFFGPNDTTEVRTAFLTPGAGGNAAPAGGAAAGTTSGATPAAGTSGGMTPPAGTKQQ